MSRARAINGTDTPEAVHTPSFGEIDAQTGVYGGSTAPERRNHVKSSLQDIVAGSVWHFDDGEPAAYLAVGRFGEISSMDGQTFDVWIVSRDRSPIGARKLSNLLEHVPPGIPVRRLDGEAWLQTEDTELVRRLAPVLGIKRRRHISEEQRVAMAARLTTAREAVKEAA